MKTKRLLSIIGLTLLALSPTAWAAGHSGGGGGFHGGGVRFGGGVPRFSGMGPRFAGGTGMSRTRPHLSSGPNRGINRPAAWSVARSRGGMASAARPSRTFPQRGLNGGTNHIAERHEANWHGEWDRRHAHFFHNRFFVFIG